MGTTGIPRQFILDLAANNNSTVFVETGTFLGVTARWAAEYFETVHTIEKAESLYQGFINSHLRLNIRAHLGDSRIILSDILTVESNNRAVFWLDGHWCGGESAGENDECPLLG